MGKRGPQPTPIPCDRCGGDQRFPSCGLRECIKWAEEYAQKEEN